MRRVAPLIAALAVFALAGCSQSETSSAVTPTTVTIEPVECEVLGDDGRPATAELTVEMGEWYYDIPDDVPVGAVAVNAVNVGETNHEMVIVRADPDDPLDLPVDGAYVDEAALGAEAFVGALGTHGPATSCEGTFVLDPGTYVAFCNLSASDDQGRASSHYALGMVTSFEVG